MGVAHVGLVHRDSCECKVKGFRAVSSIERNVSNRRHLQGVRQTPPSGPTPEPISVSTPVSLVRSSFLQQLETVVKTPFRPPGQGPIFRLPVSSPTPASVGTDTQDTPEVSSSMRSADKGTETTSLAPRMTRSAAKQTPGSSPRPKRAYVSPSKGSSSKRRR